MAAEDDALDEALEQLLALVGVLELERRGYSSIRCPNHSATAGSSSGLQNTYT